MEDYPVWTQTDSLMAPEDFTGLRVLGMTNFLGLCDIGERGFRTGEHGYRGIPAESGRLVVVGACVILQK